MKISSLLENKSSSDFSPNRSREMEEIWMLVGVASIYVCVYVPKPAKSILIELRCWNFRPYSFYVKFLDDITVFAFLFSNSIFVLAPPTL